jgi:kumamolisin
MRHAGSSRRAIRKFAPILCAVSLLLGLALVSRAAPLTTQTVFENSIQKPVASATNKAVVAQNVPTVVRSQLTNNELQENIRFSIALKMRNFAELQDRVSMHELIPLDEIRDKYFPAPSDVANVRQWLISQGFQVEPPVPYEFSVFASGSVAQLQRVFGSTFARVQFRGEEHTSAITAPSLPANIASAVLSINGLQPHLHPVRHSTHQPISGSQTGNRAPLPVPQIVSAYDMLVGNGAGQTIGVIIDTFPKPSDLVQFWSANQVPQALSNIQEVQVVPGSLSAPSGEETLDVSWSSAIASGATIRVYATTDLTFSFLDQAYQFIINELPSQPTLHQISMSYGIGEDYVAPSQLQTDDAFFITLTAAGISLFAPSGDGGSNPDQNDNYSVSNPLQVEYPASDPHVIAVGGTTLLVNPDGTLLSETGWSGSGGGISGFFWRPSWQASFSIGGTGRIVPDVSMDADPNTGVFLVLNGDASQQWGGTSLGPPIWAGICARLNQVRAANGVPTLGFLAPKIYPLLNSCFRDIVSGSNGAYAAVAGFDLVTGLGSPLAYYLNSALGGTAPPGSGIAKDFNNNGVSDVIWENSASGERVIWLMRAGQPTGRMNLPTVPAVWHIAGVGDFMGNGQSDLVWENANTGEHLIWIIYAGTPQYTISLPTVASGWHIVGSGDFNGDGQADLVLENSVTGEREIWLMSNAVPIGAIRLPTLDPSWHIAGVGDFLGNKQSDLIWENHVTGQRVIWLMNYGTPTTAINLPNVDPGWEIGGAGDFFGTGQASLVWRNNSNGQSLLWQLINGQPIGAVSLPPVDTRWNIVDH